MFTTQKTMDALISRFEAAGWQRIQVTIKATGDTVDITPCYYGEKPEHGINSCEFFLIDTDCMNLCGSDDLADIANILNNFRFLKANDRICKQRLADFYTKYLQGKTEEDWARMRQVNQVAQRLWFEAKVPTWEDFIREQIPAIAYETKLSIKNVENALEFSDHVNHYHDRYKDLYGVSPDLS